MFKVREALIMPPITPMPGAPKHVLGVANIRGQIIPVVDLPSVVGCKPSACNILLVTEYERSVQGFAVEEVEEIVRLEWGRVVSAERSAVGGMVTSLARLDEKGGERPSGLDSGCGNDSAGSFAFAIQEWRRDNSYPGDQDRTRDRLCFTPMTPAWPACRLKAS